MIRPKRPRDGTQVRCQDVSKQRSDTICRRATSPGRNPREASLSDDRSPTAFFLLLVIIALPLWLVSGRLGVISALRIPTSDLALAFSPLAAAFAITAQREGW